MVLGVGGTEGGRGGTGVGLRRGTGGGLGWWTTITLQFTQDRVIPRKPNEDTAPFLYQRREVKTFSKDRIIENQDRKLSQ